MVSPVEMESNLGQDLRLFGEMLAPMRDRVEEYFRNGPLPNKTEDLFKCYVLGVHDPYEIIKDSNSLTAEQLLFTASYLAIRNSDPMILYAHVSDIANSTISGNNLKLIASAIINFPEFDFQVAEAVGWDRLRYLHAESVRENKLVPDSEKQFFDALVSISATNQHNVDQALDLLLNESRNLLEDVFYSDLTEVLAASPGVAVRMADWLIRNGATLQKNSIVMQIVAQESAEAANLLLPVLVNNLPEVIHLSRDRKRLEPSKRSISYEFRGLSRLPREGLLRRFSSLALEVGDSLMKDSSFEKEQKMLVNIVSRLIQGLRLDQIDMRLLHMVANMGYPEEALDLVEKHEDFESRQSLHYHKLDYLKLRYSHYRECDQRSSEVELDILEEFLNQDKGVHGDAVIIFYFESITRYLDHSPHAVLDLIQKHTPKGLRLDAQYIDIARRLDKMGFKNAAVAWLKRFQVGKVGEVNYFGEYMQFVQGSMLDDLDFSQQNYEGLQDSFSRLSMQEQQFGLLALRQAGIFSEAAKDMLDSLPRYLPMAKTGSEFGIFTRDISGVIKHKLNKGSAEIWTGLADSVDPQIAVAPVLKTRRVDSEKELVYSRVCGIDMLCLLSNFFGYKRLIEDNILIQPRARRNPTEDTINTLEDIQYISHDPMLNAICMQALNVIDRLNSLRLDHGHLHMRNFTVEWIEAHYLARHLNGPDMFVSRNGSKVLQKPNVNNIGWSHDHFTFDPDEAMSLNKTWIPIVRVIDFDRITYK